MSTLLIVLLSAAVLAVEPFGATVNPVVPSDRAPIDSAGNDPNAVAGNISSLTITGYSITQAWHGYFGNVSGTVMLADSGDNVMYNWSLASPEGEVYASTNNSVVWVYIQCLNFTSDGTYGDDTGNAGSTSLHGTNLTILMDQFGVDQGDVDAPNNTFSLAGTHESGEGLTHDQFYTNNFNFSAGECLSTHLFAASNSSEDSKFQEVLLYDPSTSSVVFTSILDEETPLGFDAKPHDFEMLVLENGHLTDTSPTPYYFWVELE